MRKTFEFSLILLLFIAVFSCSKSTQNEEKTTEAKEVAADGAKDVNDLTYREVVDLVFKDNGEGVEWHGEVLPNELVEYLVLSEGDPCGEEDCGKDLTIQNTSDKTIVAITRGDFDINEEQGYLARKYTIAAGQTLSMGCSHLCYQGEGYPFPRTVVGSEYLE